MVVLPGETCSCVKKCIIIIITMLKGYTDVSGLRDNKSYAT